MRSGEALYNPGVKQYKKYPNRRLYDIEASRYVTLADLRRVIARGESVEVTDSRTGKDLTRALLLQIIAEQEVDERKPILTNRVLEHLIRFYSDSMNSLVSRYIEQSIMTFIEQQNLYRERMKTIGELEPIAMIREALERNIEFWTNLASPKPGGSKSGRRARRD